MGLISLFQAGLIKQLPDLPGKYFDAERVDASPEAYQKLAVPDSFLGLVSYNVTTLLAVAGPGYPPGVKRVATAALLGKTTIDFWQAAILSRAQWTKQKAFCIWCLGASAATTYSLVQSARLFRATDSR